MVFNSYKYPIDRDLALLSVLDDQDIQEVKIMS